MDYPPVAYRLNEAAKALRVCPRTLWSWVKAGKIPSVRMGRVLLIPADALRDWLTQEANKRVRTAGRVEASAD